MGIESITRTDQGHRSFPQSPTGWAQWVSATKTRHHVLGDPLLDWLDLYGEDHGFKPDQAFPPYDPRTDFTAFVFKQGQRFEHAVVDLLSRRHAITTITKSTAQARDLKAPEATFAAMMAAAPIIAQGVLWNPEHQIYGIPDLLVRSDILHHLFPESLTEDAARIPAPDLGGVAWHYRVVDIKFRTLRLTSGGELDNGGSAQAHKVQTFLYNQALGRIQGFEPPTSYLLGRGWTQTKQRGSNCFDRLAPIQQAGAVANKKPISETAEAAISWMHRVRQEGSQWQVLPEPSCPDLYPNNTNLEDGPWHIAKQQIAKDLEDLTLLWQVGVSGRRLAHDVGITRWTDPSLTPETVGIKGGTQQGILTKILHVNTGQTTHIVQPETIHSARDQWHQSPQLEFYVDFETVSDLADDFSQLPEKGGQSLIFMIGCGYVNDEQWTFRSFVVDAITQAEEGRIIQEWLVYMEDVRQQSGSTLHTPKVLHWSPAEASMLETAYNSAWQRHERPDWPAIEWFDFWKQVMRAEPVVINGSLGFGLKSVARALHKHGLIETLWEDGPTNGLGAMVGAWFCSEQARATGISIPEIPLMDEIISYNEVDCRVMMEVIRYLRREH